jgi:hypothetical protein
LKGFGKTRSGRPPIPKVSKGRPMCLPGQPHRIAPRNRTVLIDTKGTTMKPKTITLIFALILLTAGAAAYADSGAPEGHAYIGVLLDPAPLPALLTKHLGLSPDQGIRIQNIDRNSPADKAGLERDDLIIGLNGKDVVDYNAFVDEIRKAGVGTEISLQIIHLGQRKTVTLTLEASKGDFDLKYPPEPDVVQSWRPGKIFRLRPGDENWMEMLQDGLGKDLDANVKRFFNELYTYHHTDGDGHEYTVTIEGNPNDDDSTISVQAGDNEYKTAIKEIDKLPEQYRESAEQAVKDAREAAKGRRFGFRTGPNSWRMPDGWKGRLDRMRPDMRSLVPPFEPGGPMFDRIEKQMKELQKRLDKLEKRGVPKDESKSLKKQDSQKEQTALPLEQGDQKSV